MLLSEGCGCKAAGCAGLWVLLRAHPGDVVSFTAGVKLCGIVDQNRTDQLCGTVERREPCGVWRRDSGVLQECKLS